MDVVALTMAALVCGILALGLWWLARFRLGPGEEAWRKVADDAGLVYHPRRRPFGPRITGPFEGGMSVDLLLEDRDDPSRPTRLRIVTGRTHGFSAGPDPAEVLALLPDDGGDHLEPLVEDSGIVEAQLQADMLELRCAEPLSGEQVKKLLRAALRAAAPLARVERTR